MCGPQPHYVIEHFSNLMISVSFSFLFINRKIETITVLWFSIVCHLMEPHANTPAGLPRVEFRSLSEEPCRFCFIYVLIRKWIFRIYHLNLFSEWLNLFIANTVLAAHQQACRCAIEKQKMILFFNHSEYIPFRSTLQLTVEIARQRQKKKTTNIFVTNCVLFENSEIIINLSETNTLSNVKQYRK